MKKKPYFSSTVSVDKISSKGFGIGSFQKSEGAPVSKVLVPAVIPGDVVLAEIGPKRKGVYVGKALEVLQSSENRVAIRCSHVGKCGGCSLQQMSYPAQLTHKEEIIKELFAPIFEGAISSIIPSAAVWHYRNKMEYTFSQDAAGRKFLGLVIAASKGRVEPLQECYIAPLWFTQLLECVRKWWDDTGLLAFCANRNSGSLRTLTLREGLRTQEKMAILTVSGVPEYSLTKEHLHSFVAALKSLIPDETFSVFLRIQQTSPGKETQFYEMQLSGPAWIHEELEISVLEYRKTLKFTISPSAFFQPNTTQAEKIYSKALELAGMRHRRCVLDLYAGTATLGMVFAPFADKVIAIEINPYAVFDGEVNRKVNEIDNLQIFKGDVAQVLSSLKDEVKNPDLALLDPPRTGLSKESIQIIADLQPAEIIYISCVPQTQARDCELLKEVGYKIISIQPVDQFPHTIHIENIVLLQK